MDKIEAIEKLKLYSEQIKEISNPELIYMFGSFANGNWHKDSDIDVALVFDKLQENQFELMKKILKLRREIDLRIEPVIFEKDKDPSGFLESIMKSGELIYKRVY